MTTENTKQINLGEDFGAVTVIVNGKRIEIGSDGTIGKIEPANGNTITAIASAKEALEVGDHMKDGTVVIAVDLKNNKALFAPEGIFGGDSSFDDQDSVVKQSNAQALDGHKDWRRITDEEAISLAKAWDRVAPPALQGDYAPWFWGASANGDGDGIMFNRDYSMWNDNDRYKASSAPVPVVRSGSATPKA